MRGFRCSNTVGRRLVRARGRTLGRHSFKLATASRRTARSVRDTSGFFCLIVVLTSTAPELLRACSSCGTETKTPGSLCQNCRRRPQATKCSFCHLPILGAQCSAYERRAQLLIDFPSLFVKQACLKHAQSAVTWGTSSAFKNGSAHSVDKKKHVRQGVAVGESRWAGCSPDTLTDHHRLNSDA